MTQQSFGRSYAKIENIAFSANDLKRNPYRSIYTVSQIHIGLVFLTNLWQVSFIRKKYI